MRLLLILSLLLASLAMVAAAPSQAAEANASCHAIQPASAPTEDDRNTGESPNAIHACPGCATFSRAAPAGPAHAVTAVPQDRAPPAPLFSRSLAPIPPPPRAA